jgi:hypothetical protein
VTKGTLFELLVSWHHARHEFGRLCCAGGTSIDLFEGRALDTNPARTTEELELDTRSLGF